MNFSCLHPRDQIVATMERIYGRNMTTTSGGNISIHDENGDKWMTPARVDKGSLRRQDIVRIGRDGVCEGLHPPSSENPFHLSIYTARPDIRAIIHAHPGALVSFSICGQAPDTRLFPEAWNVCGKVAFARYEVPGSKQLWSKNSRGVCLRRTTELRRLGKPRSSRRRTRFSRSVSTFRDPRVHRTDHTECQATWRGILPER